MIRLALRVDAAHAELVLAELLEFAPAGVEESQDGDQVEYALYGAPGELPALDRLQTLVAGALVTVSTSEVDDDWSERWRDFHRPLRLASPGAGVPALAVRPPWEPIADGELEVVIDPGRAFGTGSHATTRMSLELLLSHAAGEHGAGPALDVGTGSGVLAIAAAKLGYGPVAALDSEEEAVEAARENARVNGVDVVVERVDLRRDALPWPAPAPEVLVLANLLRPLLLELAAGLGDLPATLIASGLLEEELDEVAAAFTRRGLAESSRLTSEGWGALLFGAR